MPMGFFFLNHRLGKFFLRNQRLGNYGSSGDVKTFET